MNSHAYYLEREISRLRGDIDLLVAELAEVRAERDESLRRHAVSLDAALRERDEARAEVARLRGELTQARMGYAQVDGKTHRFAPTQRTERDLLAAILAAVEAIRDDLRSEREARR